MSPQPPSTALDRIPAEDFSALLDQTVRVCADGVEVAATVVEVTASLYPSERPLPGFSLVLRGPHAPAFGQGMLTLEHPLHGLLQVFATPLGPDPHGMRYEVVFN